MDEVRRCIGMDKYADNFNHYVLFSVYAHRINYEIVRHGSVRSKDGEGQTILLEKERKAGKLRKAILIWEN